MDLLYRSLSNATGYPLRWHRVDPANAVSGDTGALRTIMNGVVRGIVGPGDNFSTLRNTITL